MDNDIAQFNVALMQYYYHHHQHHSRNTSIPFSPKVPHHIVFSHFHEDPSHHDEHELVDINCTESYPHELDYDNNNCYSVDISMILPATPMLQFSLNGIGISVVALLGIIGNILSGVVLSRPQMKSSVNCLLLGLAFCDTLLISISILIFSMPFLHGHFESTFLWKYTNIYFGLWVPYLYPISTTAQTGSVYLTLAVTIERYVAVCHSLKARSICTWGRAKTCVAAVFSLSIFYNLPRWWEVIAIPVCEKVDNLTLYVSDKSLLRYDPTYVTVYINWTYLVVMYLIPFTGLVVLNTAIYRQVRRANQERQQLSKHQRREMGLATMLLVVVVVFLLCNVLPLVNNVLESFYNISFDQLVAISNFLVVFNSSVNFVIYCTCGERFRRTLIGLVKDFVHCRFGKRRNTYRGCLNRKSTYFPGGQLEEMSLRNLSLRTQSIIVDLSSQCDQKHMNRSCIYKTGQGISSMSRVKAIQSSYSLRGDVHVGASRGSRMVNMVGRIADGIPRNISQENL